MTLREELLFASLKGIGLSLTSDQATAVGLIVEWADMRLNTNPKIGETGQAAQMARKALLVLGEEE